jgi:hypothetical protein
MIISYSIVAAGSKITERTDDRTRHNKKTPGIVTTLD